MEKLIRNTVVEHMESNRLFTTHQYGFRKGYSCNTQLLEALEDWTEAIELKKEVDILYIDLRKAFDTVPHQRLLKKLKGYGIEGNIYSWIEDFLKDRKQKVVVNGEESDWTDIQSGIPQGSVLGPVLFLIYVNDLPDVVECMIKMFADDTKLYGQVNGQDGSNTIQSSLHNTCTWMDSWQLGINKAKCKHLHIGANNTNKYNLTDKDGNQFEVKQVEQEKDLGVIFDSKLKFCQHINAQIAKANRNVGIIFRSFTYIDKDSFLTLYKCLVRSHLEYCSSVWSPMYKKDSIALENVQRRATRMVGNLSVKSYPERLKTLGIPSLEYRRVRADMVQVYKIMHDLDHVDKDKLFTRSTYASTRGNRYKLFKKRARLSSKLHTFSHRVVEVWNKFPDNIVEAPTLNTFKSRLNKHWHTYPTKFNPSCYT